MSRCALALVVLLCVSAAAPAHAAGSGWKAPPVPAEAPEALVTGLAEADKLYASREKGDNLERAVTTLKKLAAEHPESWDVQWRLARVLFWQSEGLPASAKDKRRAISTEGWKAGEKAQQLKPGAAEGPYFMALNIGEYSHSIGILTALGEGIEAKFRDPLLAVSKSAPKVDHGGVWNALGRYKFELPWPKQDLDQSIAWLRKGLEVNPENLRARVFLAESLAERDDDGDEEEAKKLLVEVAKAPVGRYDAGEEARSKGLAKALVKRLEWSIEGL